MMMRKREGRLHRWLLGRTPRCITEREPRLFTYNGHAHDHYGWADLIDGRDCYCWKDRT